MNNRVWITGILLTAVLLSGCSLPENMPKLQELLPKPAQSGETAGAGTQGPAAEAELLQSETAVPENGTLVHIERTVKTAVDPAGGNTRILTFSWDSVRLESQQQPEAAALITEEMAGLQDIWYTGNGSAETGNNYGFHSLLEAAEDNYTIARETGRAQMECSATRYISVLRADSDICAFLVTIDINLGYEQESTFHELLCFDAKSGRPIELETEAADAEGLRQAVDTRWPPKQAVGTAEVSIVPLAEIPEDSIEIVDQVIVGDGGEAYLLVFSGTALDVEICEVTLTDRFLPDRELFHCGNLSDCALQLAILFPGDLPNTMLRYRDNTGEHEYLITLSGEDGSILLVDNTQSNYS